MYDETIYLSDTEMQRRREQSKSCAPNTSDNSMGCRGEGQPLTSSHWILRLPALTWPTLPATRCHRRVSSAKPQYVPYRRICHPLSHPTIPIFPMC